MTTQIMTNKTVGTHRAGRSSDLSGWGQPDLHAPQTVTALRDQIRRMQHAQRAADPTLISSGFEAIDRMLPDGGYLPGALVEFVSDAEGDAARWMSLHLVSRALSSRGGSIVLVDAERELYAPGLAALGIPLEQTVIIHGNRNEDLYWAIDQSLRCEAVAAVWGQVPTTDSRWLRRFQLSAESSGTLGIFLRPASVLPHPTWSDIQWHCNPRGGSLREPASAQSFSAAQVHGSELPHKELPHGDWQFRLRLVRARTGAGSEIGLAIDADSGQLKIVQPNIAAPTKTHRGPIAPPPNAKTDPASLIPHRENRQPAKRKPGAVA